MLNDFFSVIPVILEWTHHVKSIFGVPSWQKNVILGMGNIRCLFSSGMIFLVCSTCRQLARARSVWCHQVFLANGTFSPRLIWLLVLIYCYVTAIVMKSWKARGGMLYIWFVGFRYMKYYTTTSFEEMDFLKRDLLTTHQISCVLEESKVDESILPLLYCQ